MRCLRVRPWAYPGQRLARLRDASLVALGVAAVAVWGPLERPGPKLCLLRHAVALPCPLCGLTRGVSLCLRGRPLAASAFNPLAVPLLLLALLFGVKWGAEYLGDRRLEIVWRPGVARAAAWAGHLTLLAAWAYLLVWRREDDFASSWLGRLLR
jgi:hypothetical protein